MPQPTALPRPWLRLAVLALLLVAGLAVLLLAPLPPVDELRVALERAGPWAAVAFAAAYVLATLLMLPKNVLSAAAGLAFGLSAGAVLVWFAAVVGASAAFWVGRLLGRDGVARIAGRHMERLDSLVERHGVLAVLALRLVPVAPFTAVNYGSGLTSIRFSHYLVATAVGIVPGTAAYVALGAYGATPTSWQFVVAASALLALSLAGVIVARVRRGVR